MLLIGWSLLKYRRLLKLSPQERLGVDTPDTRQKLLLLLLIHTSVRRGLHSELLVDRGSSWSHSYRTLLLKGSRFKEKGVGST